MDKSRRDFLVRTAAVAGAGAVMGSLASSASADEHRRPTIAPKPRIPVGDGETIRMGVIGTGGMGTGHCHAICNLAAKGLADVQIVALSDVCDSRLENARKVCAEKQGIEVDTHRDYHELLGRDDINAVLVASPEHWHGQMIIDALTAGKDLYCEKPMTLRMPEALDVFEYARASENIFQIGTQKMMLPRYNEARKLIADGAIGKPTCSQTSYCRNSKNGEWLYYGIDPNWEPGVNLDWDAWCGPVGPQPWDPEVYARWRRYRKFSTGIIGDLLVHVMTPLIHALNPGWPTRVVATGGHYIDKAMENHDQINLNVEFESEHTMVVAGSTCNEVGLETLIRGHEGNIYLGGRDCVMRPERIFADDVDARTVACKDIGNDQDQLRLNWLKCIRTREQPASPVEHATKVMVVVALATRSLWEGGAFAFDPKTLKVRKL